MSIINNGFIDGFDHYAQADASKKWSSIEIPFSLSTTDGRFSGSTAAHGVFRNTFNPEVANFTIGGACKTGSSFINGFNVFHAKGPQNDAKLNWSQDGRLVIKIDAFFAGSAYEKVTNLTKYNMRENKYYAIEWYLSIAQSPDPTITPHLVTSQVWIDDIEVLNVVNESYYRQTPNVKFNEIGSASGTWIDDLYIMTGRFPNGRIITLRPDADGTYTEWDTPVSPHYIAVDDVLLNVTDGIGTNTPNDRDTFTHENLPAAGLVGNPLIVQQDFYGVGSDKIYHLWVDGGDQTALGISGAFSLNVHTGKTVAFVNGMDYGVKYTL